MAFIHPVDRVPHSRGSAVYLPTKPSEPGPTSTSGINEESELYDLEAGPYKLQSIHETAANPSLVADFKAKLDALRTCAGQSCRDAEDIP